MDQMKWWTTSATNRCDEDLAQKTSTYIVGLMVIIFMLSKEWASRLRVLSKIVAVVGIMLTVNDASHGRCGILVTLLSFICHMVPYVVYIIKTKPTLRYSASLYALCVLLSILFVYLLSNSWPYTLNPLTVGAGVLAIAMTSLE